MPKPIKNILPTAPADETLVAPGNIVIRRSVGELGTVGTYEVLSSIIAFMSNRDAEKNHGPNGKFAGETWSLLFDSANNKVAIVSASRSPLEYPDK
jgi:hypothetical protein